MRKIKKTVLGHPDMVTTLILLSVAIGLSPAPVALYPSGCFCSRTPNPAGKLNVTRYNNFAGDNQQTPEQNTQSAPKALCPQSNADSDLTNQGNSVFVFDLFMPVSGWLVVALAVPVIQLPLNSAWGLF